MTPCTDVTSNNAMRVDGASTSRDDTWLRHVCLKRGVAHSCVALVGHLASGSRRRTWPQNVAPFAQAATGSHVASPDVASERGVS